MARNSLQICNAALIKVGIQPITGLDEKTVTAEIIRHRYGACRDLLLQNHAWHFAKARTILAASTSYDSMGYAYVYPLPSDHGRTVSVKCGDDQVHFERFGNTLVSNTFPVTLTYIKAFHGTDDSVIFPDDFSEALASYLGADTAVALVKDQGLRQQLFQQYADTLTMARHNGSVDTYNGPEVGLWVDIRNNSALTPSDTFGSFQSPTNVPDTWGEME